MKTKLLFTVNILLLILAGSCASKKSVASQDDTSQASAVVEGQAETSPKILQEKYERGIAFMATGNEPFWSLEIYGDNLIDFKTLSPEDESIKVPMSVVAELKEGENVTYQAETSDGDFIVELLREDCQDSMSGKKSPYTVTVQYKNQEYKGCGNYLSDSRLEGTWTLEQLNGKEVTLNKKPFLSFSLAHSRVSGNAGCNRISGSMDLKWNRLYFGAIAVTRMACPDMVIENEVLQLLNKSEFEYRIVEGKLLLFQGGNEVMVLKQ